MHITADVSYAGFEKLLQPQNVSVGRYMTNKFTEIFVSVVCNIRGLREKPFFSKKNTLKSYKGVTELFLLSSCHAMNCCIYLATYCSSNQ